MKAKAKKFHPLSAAGEERIDQRSVVGVSNGARQAYHAESTTNISLLVMWICKRHFISKYAGTVGLTRVNKPVNM